MNELDAVALHSMHKTGSEGLRGAIAPHQQRRSPSFEDPSNHVGKAKPHIIKVQMKEFREFRDHLQVTYMNST